LMQIIKTWMKPNLLCRPANTCRQLKMQAIENCRQYHFLFEKDVLRVWHVQWFTCNSNSNSNNNKILCNIATWLFKGEARFKLLQVNSIFRLTASTTTTLATATTTSVELHQTHFSSWNGLLLSRRKIYIILLWQQQQTQQQQHSHQSKFTFVC